MSYLLIRHHWINPRRFSEMYTFVKAILGCVYIYLLFFWCCHKMVGARAFFCTFGTFSGLDLVWQPGSLTNMNGSYYFT